MTLPYTDHADVGKSFNSREFLASQRCLITLFANFKFSRDFIFIIFINISPEVNVIWSRRSKRDMELQYTKTLKLISLIVTLTLSKHGSAQHLI